MSTYSRHGFFDRWFPTHSRGASAPQPRESSLSPQVLLQRIVDRVTRSSKSTTPPKPPPKLSPAETLFNPDLLVQKRVNRATAPPGHPSAPRPLPKPRPQSSFNPQLFVQRMVDKVTPSGSFQTPKPPRKPKPSFPSQPRHFPSELPYLIDPPATGEYRGGGTPLLSSPYGRPLETAVLSGSRLSDRMESIQAWQRRTLQETRGIRPPPPVDMSEELSSYYDDNATESARVKTPPPRTRHFTVMNN